MTMNEPTPSEAAARRHITERCLIAADVDKTVLGQTKTNERSEFLRYVAPKLLEAADIGMNLAFVTGNSMSQLGNRFLRWLLTQLCHSDDLHLLQQFHFFCNSGGVYFHFSNYDDAIAEVLEDQPLEQEPLFRKVFDNLTKKVDNSIFVLPRFVDATYLSRTQIPTDEANEIDKILDELGRRYFEQIQDEKSSLAQDYDLKQITGKHELKKPFVDMRHVEYGSDDAPRQATVQLTLKPILSFRHALTENLKKNLFEKDLRTKLRHDIQAELDAHGLGHYIARPGGRSSIDVTFEKLDKAYAMEFLIDYLNLQGSPRQGQRFGANAIYFGDEVIVGGGNDYPVTRVPGLLVFAVNPDKQLIPFLSHVFVPSSILEGPEATADVLTELNRSARESLKSWQTAKTRQQRYDRYDTAIDCFKVKLFGQRVSSKINALKSSGKLSPEEWQVLHTFVTLMHRDDKAARRWLEILVDELDAIMTQITHNPPQSVQKGIGTSHPDN